MLSAHRHLAGNTYALCDNRTDENVLPLRPNRVFGDGVALAKRRTK